jgi:hypothetical protein
MNIEHQIKRIRAATNTLMVLKKNTKATPYLRGLTIMGALERAERTRMAHQNGILSDMVASQLLEGTATYLESMLQIANDLITGVRIWKG